MNFTKHHSPQPRIYLLECGEIQIYPKVQAFTDDGQIMVDGEWITPQGELIGGHRNPNLDRKVLVVDGHVYISIQAYCRCFDHVSPSTIYAKVVDVDSDIRGKQMRVVRLGDVLDKLLNEKTDRWT